MEISAIKGGGQRLMANAIENFHFVFWISKGFFLNLKIYVYVMPNLYPVILQITDFLKGQPFLVILRYLSCWLYHPPRSITALCQQRGVSSVFGFLPLQILVYTNHHPPPPVNLRMPHIAQIGQDPSKRVSTLKALQFSHKKWHTSTVGF